MVPGEIRGGFGKALEIAEKEMEAENGEIQRRGLN
jgi:hypothetical protein